MYFRRVQNLRFVFISDLGHSSPKVPMIAHELGAQGDIEVFVISPKINSYQKDRFMPLSAPNFEFIEFKRFHSNYKRFDFLPKYFAAGIRKSQKMLRLFLQFFFRNQFIFGLSISEIDKWLKELEVIQSEKGIFDSNTIVISSSSPFISHVVSSRLAKKYDFVWVPDYRDPWSTNHVKFLDNVAEAKKFEIGVLSNSVGIIASSNQLICELKELHTGPFEIVHNGFSDLAKPLNRVITPPLRMAYIGQIYPGFQEYEQFLVALDYLNSSSVLLEVIFVGGSIQDVHNYYSSLNRTVPSYVFLKYEIPMRDVSEELSDADLLLFFTWNKDLRRTSDFRTTVIGSKIYDYLGAQRFIVAFGPNCDREIDDLLGKTRVGQRVENAEEFQKLLDTIYSAKALTLNSDLNEIKKYTYKSQANNLLLFVKKLRSST